MKSFRRITLALLVLIVLSLLVDSKPAKAQPPNCNNQICASILLYIGCYISTPPYVRVPNHTENGWAYEANQLGGWFSSSGSMYYNSTTPTYHVYRTLPTTLENWQAGNYRVRVKKLPAGNPPLVSAWLYQTVNQGGILSPAFYVVYHPSPSFPLCNP